MKLISTRRRDQLCADFEYEIINRYRHGPYRITWLPQDQTCVLTRGDQVIETGSFRHLLDHFVQEDL